MDFNAIILCNRVKKRGRNAGPPGRPSSGLRKDGFDGRHNFLCQLGNHLQRPHVVFHLQSNVQGAAG